MQLHQVTYEPAAQRRCRCHTRSSASAPSRRLHSSIRCSITQNQRDPDTCTVIANPSRRQCLTAMPAAAVSLQQCFPARADDFSRMPSGLLYLDVREGTGAVPELGDTVVVHWSGYTQGYQGKRIDNTSVRDEPYEFVLGGDQAIKAFQEAVGSMRVGGIRRVEVPGDCPELSYPRDRVQRFTSELLAADGKIFKYRYGPQPAELGGQRALDFVLDNPTLQGFNRTLLFDIKLLSVRKGSRQ